MGKVDLSKAKFGDVFKTRGGTYKLEEATYWQEIVLPKKEKL
jgi:hypothetical protein